MRKNTENHGRLRILSLLGLMSLINFLLFHWPGFPGSLSAITSGLPVSSVPDVNIFYSPEQIYDFFTQIGPTGREAFRMMHLSVDLTFPLIYSLFFFLLINHLVKRLSRKTKWLSFFPLLAGAFDLTENFRLNYLAREYPAYHPELTVFVEWITILKFAFLGFSVMITVYLVLRGIRGRPTIK